MKYGAIARATVTSAAFKSIYSRGIVLLKKLFLFARLILLVFRGKPLDKEFPNRIDSWSARPERGGPSHKFFQIFYAFRYVPGIIFAGYFRNGTSTVDDVICHYNLIIKSHRMKKQADQNHSGKKGINNKNIFKEFPPHAAA